MVAALDGETIDEICWRALGRTSAVTEQVLELNRGLAALGPLLPGGTLVALPDPAAISSSERQTVKLWD